MFRKVVYCSGGLYAVQVGYMLFRWVEIMMSLVATNIVASRRPEHGLTVTPTARAKGVYKNIITQKIKT